MEANRSASHLDEHFRSISRSSSFLTQADLKHPMAFDVLFNKAANITLNSLPQSSRDFSFFKPSELPDTHDYLNNSLSSKAILSFNVDPDGQNLTMDSLSTSAVFNTSILSGLGPLTIHPFGSDGGGIHHRLQALKYERMKRHSSTLISSKMRRDGSPRANHKDQGNQENDVEHSKDTDEIETDKVPKEIDFQSRAPIHQRLKRCTKKNVKRLSEEEDSLSKAVKQDDLFLFNKAALMTEEEDIGGEENQPCAIEENNCLSSRNSVSQRSKRSSKKTPKMVDFMKATSASSKSKPVVELTDWNIRPLPDRRQICVEGKKKGMMDFWHSTAITEARTRKLVITSSGSCYQLNGKLNKMCTIHNGFTADVAQAFKDGFPTNWKEIIEKFYKNLEDSIPMREELSPIKIFHRRKNNSKQNKQKRTAMPKSSLEKQNTVKKSTSRAKSKQVEHEEDLDSVLTPLGLVKKSLPSNSFTFTQSGRLSLPPLARWSGQKYVFRNSEIIVDFETNDARRAVMQETRAVYNLTKQFQRMKEYKKGMLLPPNTSATSSHAALKDFNKTTSSISPDKPCRITGRKSCQGKNSNKCSLNKAQEDTTRQSFNRKTNNASKNSSVKKRNPSCHSPTPPKSSSNPSELSSNPSQRSIKPSQRLSNPSRHSSNSSNLSDRAMRSKRPTKTVKVDHKSDQQMKKSARRVRKNKLQSSEDSQVEMDSAGTTETFPKCSVSLSKDDVQMWNTSLESDTCKSEESLLKAGKRNTLSRRKCKTSIKKNNQCSRRSLRSSLMPNNKKGKDESKKTRPGDQHHEEILPTISKRDGTRKVRKRQRTRSITPSPPSNYKSKRKSQKFIDVTPKSCNGKKCMKKRRLACEEDYADSWSDHEKDCLQRALRIIDSTVSNYWEEVSALVQSKTPEECQLYHTKYLEDKTAAKLTKTKDKPQQLAGRKKGDPVRGRKGTMKRKREIRAFLDEQNEDYEDNLFDGTPFASRKPASSLISKIVFDKGDDEIFGANCNIFTPLPGQDKFMSPLSCLRMPFASAKKTPLSLTNSNDSPVSSKRLCADKYIHTFVENKKRSSTEVSNPSTSKSDSLDSSLLPKKCLFSPAEKASIFLIEGKENGELHEDEEEEDHYMYYWNDLDCSQ